MNDKIELLFDERGNKYYVLKNIILKTNKTEDVIEINNKWYFEKKLIHREDGPAIEHSDGTKYWIKNGEFHRVDGPAIEAIEFLGEMHWYQNGKLHRLDGPALEDLNGSKEYYINGIKISEEIFNLEKELRENLTNKNSSKRNKI